MIKIMNLNKDDVYQFLKNQFGNYIDNSLSEKDNGVIFYGLYKDNQLIAVSGYDFESFNYPEVTYSTTLEEYRSNGYMSTLIDNVIKDVKHLGYRYLLLNAWVLQGRDKPNIHYILDKFNFKLGIPEQRIYDKRFDCCDNCLYDIGEGCKCRTDLYYLGL